MKSTRARAALPLFFFVLIVSALPSLVYADELSVSTNKPSYGLGATVNVNGMLSLEGNPKTDGLVAVQVEDDLERIRLIRVVPTGTAPPPWKVRIIGFLSCDSQGAPKGSFSRNSLAYFKVTVESLDTILERQVTIAIDLFDWVGFSIGVVYISFSLPPRTQFTYFTSIPIPDDAFVGTGIAHVNVLTKWPKHGGYPYCAGESVDLTITGGSSQATSSTPASSTGSGGSYSLSFKLPSDSKPGNYTVFTRARYNAEATTTFDYFWLYTDVNRDGQVNIVDITKVATTFESKTGDPNYDSFADINKDNTINILDIALVAKDYGKSRT